MPNSGPKSMVSLSAGFLASGKVSAASTVPTRMSIDAKSGILLPADRVHPRDDVRSGTLPSRFRHDMVREAVVLLERRLVLSRERVRDPWHHELIVAAGHDEHR